MVAKEHPELVSAVFGYEPVVPSYIDDPDRLSAIDQDAGSMVGSVFESMEVGNFEEAARRFLAGVSQEPEYFDALSDAARQIVIDNARALPLMFDGGEQDVPISCVELAQLNPSVTIAQGEISRPFFKLIADGARECLPNGRHRIIHGARHMWPADNPEDFIQTVVETIQATR